MARRSENGAGIRDPSLSCCGEGRWWTERWGREGASIALHTKGADSLESIL